MAQATAQKVWEMMEDISICMLTTINAGEIRSRPMGAFVRPEENSVYFLTDTRQHKDEEIERIPNVCLAFANTDDNQYVSVTGRAVVSNDRAKIRELWSTPAKAWWDSPDDPNIRMLKVTPVDAEYWDSPGTVVSSIKMMAAAVSGTRPDMGENRKVAMR